MAAPGVRTPQSGTVGYLALHHVDGVHNENAAKRRQMAARALAFPGCSNHDATDVGSRPLSIASRFPLYFVMRGVIGGSSRLTPFVARIIPGRLITDTRQPWKSSFATALQGFR
jgi:hypothetical protein